MAKIPKKYYLLVDTETSNNGGYVIDYAHVLVDKSGTIIQTYNCLISDYIKLGLFTSKSGEFTSQKNAEKMKFYRREYKAGRLDFISKKELDTILDKLLSEYDNITFVAYNATFDLSALKKSGFNQFDNLPILCLWQASLKLIVTKPSYARFCLINRFFSEKIICRSNAETIFAWLTENPDFIEKHTALSDCLDVELPIFRYILRQKKKMDYKPFNWRELVVNNTAKLAYS